MVDLTKFSKDVILKVCSGHILPSLILVDFVVCWSKPSAMLNWSCRPPDWTIFFAKGVDAVGHNDSQSCGKRDLKYNPILDSTAVGCGRDAVFIQASVRGFTTRASATDVGYKTL